jgi:hypothetical protein
LAFVAGNTFSRVRFCNDASLRAYAVGAANGYRVLAVNDAT